MSNYFSSGSSNKILLERIRSSCQSTGGKNVWCWCDAQRECLAGDSAGKTASRKKSSGVRFSTAQAEGRVRSDMINAGAVLSPWLLESRSGCTDGRGNNAVPTSSSPILLKIRKKKKDCHHQRNIFNLSVKTFLTISVLFLNEQ